MITEMKMNRSLKLAAVLPLLLFVISGCATLGGQPLTIISPQEEIRLGQELSAEIEKQEPVLNNPALNQYITEVGNRVAAQTQRPDIPYTFKIIDKDEVNAFALPGGPVYVYAGLLKYADNEAELASVLGHEVAHIVARHSAQQMTREFGYSLLASILLGQDAGAAATVAADVAGSLGMLKFSRNDEIEADRLGLHYMFNAGYHPNAMVDFLTKLGELQSSNPSRVLNLLSTHPLSQARVNTVSREIATLPPGKPVDFYTERYQRIVGSALK
ncbi:MAG: M48 family metallopeptidase [Candidatus Abyssubacteria bacterium]